MQEVKLNLGCGDTPIEGFINVDVNKSKSVDVIVDLNKFPYPWKENSIDYINCDDTLEHLKEPELFWHEIHRILKPNTQIKVKVPHHKAKGAYCCFGHRSFFHEDAIDSLCLGVVTSEDNSTCRGFKLISKKLNRGRFLKWQKREIIWVVEKMNLNINDKYKLWKKIKTTEFVQIANHSHQTKPGSESNPGMALPKSSNVGIGFNPAGDISLNLKSKEASP